MVTYYAAFALGVWVVICKDFLPACHAFDICRWRVRHCGSVLLLEVES